MEEGETRWSRDTRLRESQHAVKGTKGEEMGDDIVEMTVWGEGAEENGKTGCTGCIKHVVEIHLGLMLAIYLHFASSFIPQKPSATE